MRFVPSADPLIFVNLSQCDALAVIEYKGGHSVVAIKTFEGEEITEYPVSYGTKLYSSDTNCSKENCANYLIELIEEVNEC